MFRFCLVSIGAIALLFGAVKALEPLVGFEVQVDETHNPRLAGNFIVLHRIDQSNFYCLLPIQSTHPPRRPHLLVIIDRLKCYINLSEEYEVRDSFIVRNEHSAYLFKNDDGVRLKRGTFWYSPLTNTITHANSAKDLATALCDSHLAHRDLAMGWDYAATHRSAQIALSYTHEHQYLHDLVGNYHSIAEKHRQKAAKELLEWEMVNRSNDARQTEAINSASWARIAEAMLQDSSQHYANPHDLRFQNLNDQAIHYSKLSLIDAASDEE